MILKVGDLLYCKVDGLGSLDFGKKYPIKHTREKDQYNQADVCIIYGDGYEWWFGQIGSTEPWTDWFMTEREWKRDRKLEELGIK